MSGPDFGFRGPLETPRASPSPTAGTHLRAGPTCRLPLVTACSLACGLSLSGAHLPPSFAARLGRARSRRATGNPGKRGHATTGSCWDSPSSPRPNFTRSALTRINNLARTGTTRSWRAESVVVLRPKSAGLTQ